MRNVLVVMAMALWMGRLAFAEGAGVEKPPKPGVKPAAEAKPAGEQEADKRIKEILKTKKVTFDFVETPIGDAMNFLQALLDMNLVVGPGLDKGVPLTLRVNDMAVGQALQWMAKLVDAKVDVKDGAVVIQRADEAEREFVPKPKPEKGALKHDPDRLRRLGPGATAPLAKAVIPLGNGASVELNLEEEDLDPDTRRVLLKLLHEQIAAELEKHDKGAAAEFRQAVEKRAKREAEEGARRAAEEGARRAKDLHERLRDARDKLRDKVHKLRDPDARDPQGDDNKAQF